MVLARRRQSDAIPQYSLTGDLLSFLRCGLQYRYHNGSALPPSRPVQLWFGEMIHGVMESAYRLWSQEPSAQFFPWPCNPTTLRTDPPTGRLAHDIGVLGDLVEANLRIQGKTPRSDKVRTSAYKRVERTINELAPDLFPLISSAEERVIGTRRLPSAPGALETTRAHMYELHGIIDVVSDVQLNGAAQGNLFKAAIQEAYPGLNGQFEIIVDYKGSRRPPCDHAYWHQGDWQVQTYAWLRTRQPSAQRVAAGILLYVNELSLGSKDVEVLWNDVKAGRTDVVPRKGSEDERLLSEWRPGRPAPAFSMEFRLARAIRVIPVNVESEERATSAFDEAVRQIEMCVNAEDSAGSIVAHWNACGDADTCAACDFRHFCPDPAPRGKAHQLEAPSAP